METQSASEYKQQPEATNPKNFFSRLGGVYFSPGETFREIGRAPRAWMPLLALLILGTVSGYFMSTKIDIAAMQEAQLEQAVADGKMTQEQADNALAMTAKASGVMITVASGIGSLFFVFVIAGFFKLISALIAAENSFNGVLSVTAYAILAVTIVQTVLLIIILSIKDPMDFTATNASAILASNLGAVMSALFGEDALPKFLMRLAGWVDIFAIWIIALLSIGYAAVSVKLKTSKAATWLVSAYVVIALIGSALGSLIGRG